MFVELKRLKMGRYFSQMQKEVGIAGAKALEYADLRVFSGGEGAEHGFKVGEILESMGPH